MANPPVTDDADLSMLKKFVIKMYDKNSTADGIDDARLIKKIETLSFTSIPLGIYCNVLSSVWFLFLCLFSLVSSVCLAWYSVIFLHSCSPVTSLCLCYISEFLHFPSLCLTFSVTSGSDAVSSKSSFLLSSIPTCFLKIPAFPSFASSLPPLYYVDLRDFCPLLI